MRLSCLGCHIKAWMVSECAENQCRITLANQIILYYITLMTELKKNKNNQILNQWCITIVHVIDPEIRSGGGQRKNSITSNNAVAY